ncbi:N-acetyltransferase [Macrococcus hajekii]|uniref:N-acetyltransferase n=1 Tax=Macrococcus hajekii TaxID=198482 RepID=A0A4R6BJV0_9STAP|nr:GNAT family N-acetyltransferase [Macrococcus hajekii]TDM01910.1 N-acetyltransferase [Macrococcus hajekii]GGB08485.1 N-acetyltransferase [Macrococcus hajekii]
MATFKETKQVAELYEDNSRYKHYHTPSQLIRYYSNFFEYKEMPDLITFKQDESKQQQFHQARNQQHLLFIFPENETLPQELINYAEKQNYKIEKMELYETKELSVKRQAGEVKVVCDDQTFSDFLQVCRAGELQYDEDFVDLKEEMHTADLGDETIIQLVAYNGGRPVGKLEAILNDSFIELDDFYVLEDARGKGIGSALQAQVLTYGESLILIADGNDTPREMYEKQGYKKVSERYELLKVKGSS